jgi:hypothetical protein
MPFLKKGKKVSTLFEGVYFYIENLVLWARLFYSSMNFPPQAD